MCNSSDLSAASEIRVIVEIAGGKHLQLRPPGGGSGDGRAIRGPRTLIGREWCQMNPDGTIDRVWVIFPEEDGLGIVRNERTITYQKPGNDGTQETVVRTEMVSTLEGAYGDEIVDVWAETNGTREEYFQ